MTVWFYPIDWSATGAWMQAWAGFAGAGAVLYAAHRGSASFEEWLRQRQTERKMAAAERIMTFVYKAKRSFESIRNPGSMGYESDAAEKRLKEAIPNFDNYPDWKRSRMVVGQTVYDRLDAAKDIWAELFECLPLGRAFFGEECEKQIHAFWMARAKIRTAAHMYGQVDPSGPNANTDKFEEAFWEGLDEDKPGSVSALLSRAVKYMEEHVVSFVAG